MLKKVLLLCFSLFILAFIGVVIYFFMSIKGDDGQREAISFKDIDWHYVLAEDPSMRIFEMRLNETDIDNTDDIEPIIHYIYTNKETLTEKKIDEHSVKLYISWGKVGKFSVVYDADEYDGKKTTFYINKPIIDDLKASLYTFTPSLYDEFE